MAKMNLFSELGKTAKDFVDAIPQAIQDIRDGGLDALSSDDDALKMPAEIVLFMRETDGEFHPVEASQAKPGDFCGTYRLVSEKVLDAKSADSKVLEEKPIG